MTQHFTWPDVVGVARLSSCGSQFEELIAVAAELVGEREPVVTVVAR